jgi:hypothetical protein
MNCRIDRCSSSLTLMVDPGLTPPDHDARRTVSQLARIKP